MAIDIARTQSPAAVSTAGRASVPGGERRWRQRVSGKDLIYFIAQLSLMLEVGTSLTDAIMALERQTDSTHLRDVLREVSHDLEGGQSFSAALSRHPAVFEGIFVSMVRAGETGGYLRDTLDRIVEMREKREALVAHVRTALTYPIILALVSAVVVVFILTGVLPKFMPFFEGKESLLPLTTRALMAASRSLAAYWWAWLLVAGAAAASVVSFLRSSPGRWLRDWLSVKLPVVGPLANKVLTCQLLRTLGHLLESKVALIEALKATRLTLGNRFYRALIERVGEVVEGGGRLSQAFMAFSYMPPSVRQMIATGEESGNLYPVMLRIAQRYDFEIEQELKRLASMIEPLALIVLGTVVGIIVSSVILPLFKLAHAIS